VKQLNELYVCDLPVTYSRGSRNMTTASEQHQYRLTDVRLTIYLPTVYPSILHQRSRARGLMYTSCPFLTLLWT